MPDTHPITVAIVPHTHWDREWYSPFQTFRMRLVKLLDALLPMLESDLSYARFLLDGQTAVIDDYLEVRPEARRRAAAARRVAGASRVGPWMVLMDEFMVSGETMVRDLQFGLARAAEFGGAMQVGYLPDMFGHVAQMPQLLRLVGHRARGRVARRARASVDTDRVLVGGARRLAGARRVPLRLVLERPRHPRRREGPRAARASTTSRSSAPSRLADMLLMNGTDHQMPQPWLGRVVAEANAMQDDYQFVVTSLAEYLPHAADRRASPTVARRAALGRARQPAHGRRVEPRRRAPGVRGGRACARAAGRAADALFLPARAVPARARSTSRGATSCCNSAHDSSCACSARRGRRPGARPLRRSAPDRRRARRATRCTRSRARSTRRPARPSS